MAHSIPYVATATRRRPARPRGARSTKAMSMRGARYIHIHVPCPLGWGSASDDTDPPRAARGRMRPVSGVRGRARQGDVGAARSAAQVPVDGIPEAPEALRPPVQRRRERRAHRAASRPMADRNIADYELLDRARTIDGQALRHHARPRLQPRQPDRLLAHEAAALRRPAAALQPRLPGGREHPGLAVPRRDPATTRPPGAALTEDNPLPR